MDAGVGCFSTSLGQPQRQPRRRDLVDVIRHHVWQADAVVQAHLFLASRAAVGLGWHFKRQAKNQQR
ncbi:hypothetical protein D3C75_1186880 [compost metagenome]